MTKMTGSARVLLRNVIIILLATLHRVSNVSEKVIEEIKTHILCSITFSKIVPCMRHVEKYGTVRQFRYAKIIC